MSEEIERQFDKLLDKQLMYAKQFQQKEITFEEYVVYSNMSSITLFREVSKYLILLNERLNRRDSS